MGKGGRARVVKVEGQGALRKRLMEMGLINGAEVCVRKLAPLGDPMQITVNGCELAVRKGDAAAIIVEQLP